MGLITKKVKVRWHVNNRNHYEKLGYVFTKYGDEFFVDSSHLLKGSNIVIEYECDNCGKIFECTYMEYNRRKKEANKIFCVKCGKEFYNAVRFKEPILLKTVSFEEWCIKHHREDILNRWDYDKNHCTPKDVSHGSAKSFWFKCDKCSYHRSELTILFTITCGDYNKPLKCIQCNSIAQYIIDKYGDLNKVWSDKNGDLDPWTINKGSKRKVWLKCTKTNYHCDYNTRVSHFTNMHECPYCAGMKVNPKDSLAQYIIEQFPNKSLYDIWDNEKNGDLDPWSIGRGSNTRIWIKCQEKDYHGSYSILTSNFTQGKRCSYCVGKHTVHPKDSLGQYVIDNYEEEFLWRIWSNKNDKSPFEFMPRSSKEVWLKCPNKKHEDYKRSCFLSTIANYKCPKCSKERRESYIEEKTRTYLEELGYKVRTELECSIVPKNPRTKQYLPLDNEVILENGVHLIIEVHGAQHYEYKPRMKLLNISEEEAKKKLQYQQLKDRYKRMFCKKCGYEYLELSYKYFTNDKYKEIIDNKINRILNVVDLYINNDIWFECLTVDNVAERMRKLSIQRKK